MRYSLGFVLALSLAGLQFIAIIIVVLTSYVTSERAMLKHARGLMDKAGVNAAEHTTRFMEPAIDITEQARRILDSGVVSVTDPEEMERYFFELLHTKPQLSGIYYGDEAGNFVYVMRSHGAGAYRTKVVTIEGEDRTTQYTWRNEDYSIAASSDDPDDVFDARSRPWYVEARRQNARIWTEPYTFFSSQVLGLSAAAPVRGYDDQLLGVVGIDLSIEEISLFLSDLTIGASGAAFILSDDGHAIAHPDPTRIGTQADDGSLQFIEVSDFNDPILRAAFAVFTSNVSTSTQSVRSRFEVSGDRFMTLLLPIPEIDLPWNIAVFAHENDFIQDIKDNRTRNSWIAAIISVVTALAGLTLAELILKPVRAFAVRTSLVSQGEVSTNAPLPRTYKELTEANTTLIDEIAQRRLADAKLLELNRDLSHVSRVNMMGQMATGLAHELSQPLTAISQNLDSALSVAKTESSPNEELISILTELDEQAHQGGDIIRALRSFMRKEKDTALPFDFKGLAVQTLRLMRQDLEGSDVSIELKIPTLSTAVGNRVQIAQVLINLVRNAIDSISMAECSVRKITISACQQPEAIEVSVHDSGPGVAEEMTLFKEFQSSKPDGLGLGLSISRTIVETGGGNLWYDVESQQFRFTVPCKAPLSEHNQRT